MKHDHRYQYKGIILQPLSEGELELLRAWRNDPENAKYLSPIGEITEEMQKRWFQAYLEDPDVMTFGIFDSQTEKCVGSISLYRFHNDTAELGKILIGEASAKGHHYGYRSILAASRLAFKSLGIKELNLHVFKDNKPALYIYQKAGFRILDERKTPEGRCEYTMSMTETNQIAHNMNRVQMLEFVQRGDERGHLVIAEGGLDIPFDIKRVFYIYGSDRDVVRGNHANRKSEFVLINVAGTSKVRVKDGEGNEAIYCLNRPHTGIYLPTMIWKEMFDFSEDSVLLCLSSEHYDPEEYIRDYAEYEKEIRELG